MKKEVHNDFTRRGQQCNTFLYAKFTSTYPILYGKVRLMTYELRETTREDHILSMDDTPNIEDIKMVFTDLKI